MSRSRRRGFALVLTLFVIVIISTVVFVAMSIGALDNRGSLQDLQSAQAYYLARCGITRCQENLDSNFSYAASPLTFTLPDGTCTVTAVRQGTAFAWIVTSVGTTPQATRTVTGYLQASSFAGYSYFTNAEISSFSGGTIFFGNFDHLQGSVHTNGYFSMAGQPEFQGTVSSANVGDTQYSAGPPKVENDGGTRYADSADFYHAQSGNHNTDKPVALNGSTAFSFNGGQAPVPFPSPTGTPAMQSNATNTFSGTTTIAFNSNGTATVTNGGTNTTINTAHATIWVNGNVTVTAGSVVSGQVSLGSAGNITLNGTVTEATKGVDVIGMFAQGTTAAPGNILVNTSSSTQANLELDGAYMALGSFTVNNFNSGVPRGTLNVFGSIIQNARGPVGTFDTVTQNGVSTQQLVTGYLKNYSYDNHLIADPPPNFPTTGSVTLLGVTDAGALR